MDDLQFDRIARAVAGLTSRRGLLGIAASLPLVGGVLLDDASAKRRQKRDRKDVRDQLQDEKKKKKKKKVTLCLNGQTIKVPKKKKKSFLDQGATPGACNCEPKTTTCSGKCGNVTNNCNQVVDCGTCACDPPCEECFACNETTRQCEPEPNGTACGQGPRCVDGQERAQDMCDGSGTCFEGGGNNCQPYLCAGDFCGTSCASDADCDANAFCNGSSQCQVRGNTGDSCQADDECFSGQCCGNVCRECCTSAVCTEPTAPVCFNNTCQACTANPGGCPNGTCCNSSTLQCVANCPDGEVCRETNTCGAPCTSGSCQIDEICVAGVCQECDVFDGQNLQNAIDAADAGSTLFVCPGTFPGNVSAIVLTKSINIIGAGDDVSGTFLSDRVDVEPPLEGDPPVVTLRNVRIKGQASGVNLTGSTLTMTGCTVFESTRGVNNSGGTLVMNNCNVLDNIANFADGAGIINFNGSTELDGCLIQGNSARNGAGIFTGSNPASTDSSLTLTNGTIVRGNTATAATDPTGAGILNFNSTSTVTITSTSAVCENTPLATQCSGFPQTRCLTTCPA